MDLPKIHRALTELGILDYEIMNTDSEITNATQFNNQFRKIISYDSDLIPTHSSDPNDFGVTWSQVEKKMAEIVADEPMRLLRRDRDLFLRQTDWVVTKAMEEGKNVATKWKTYRQALRDLPAKSTPKIKDGILDQSSISWPTKPS